MARVFTILGGALTIIAITMTTGHAGGPEPESFVPKECDFVTGGGFIFRDDGEQANFGAHGGCKRRGPDAPFWGHLNYVDHAGFNGVTPYHVRSRRITGYLFDPAFPNARDVCGFAVTNAGERLRFRIRMEDNGNPGENDRFGIRLSNGYLVTARSLGGETEPGGGNIQRHRPNNSTVGPNPPPDEHAMCGDLAAPEEGY